MMTGFRHALPDNRGRLLDRLLIWTAALLVLAIAAFAAYYYLDRRLQNDGAATGTAQHDVAAYEQAVRDDPQDPVARFSLAQAYFAAERYDEAVEQYQAALSVDETNLAGLLGLGRAQLAAGDAAAATASFEKIITVTADAEIAGDYEEAAHYYSGSIALDQQRPADAIAHLKEAVAIEPGDADAWHILGAAYLANGDLDEAITALSRAVVFVPNFTEAYDKLAAAYEAKGMAGESRYARGMAANSRGQHDEALRELQAAIEASPTFAAAYAGLGLTYEARSERDLAIDAYQRALQLDPADFTAQNGLARLGGSATPNAAEPARTTP
jgi:tetratricopeptide (TPR) repeat protein